MVENRELSIIIVWPEIVQEHQFVPLMQTNFNPSARRTSVLHFFMRNLTPWRRKIIPRGKETRPKIRRIISETTGLRRKLWGHSRLLVLLPCFSSNAFSINFAGYSLPSDRWPDNEMQPNFFTMCSLTLDARQQGATFNRHFLQFKIPWRSQQNA